MFNKIAGLFLCGLFMLACSPSNTESLNQQNRRFSQQLIWNDLKTIQVFFKKDKHAQLSLHLNEYLQNNKIIDVSTLSMEKNSDNNTALITLTLQWHGVNDVTIQQSLWQAQWEYVSSRKNWFLSDLKKL
ncbi:hypothetical protein MRY82_04230 [bacterium]|nr:hypothetical protein [bacterium]